MKKFDRYSLLCVTVSLMILVAVFIDRDEPEDEDVFGVVYDIKTTKNGYTFFFEDSDGGRTSCFARTEPTEYGVYSIRGSFSDDGGIFFVNSMDAVSQNKLYRN